MTTVEIVGQGFSIRNYWKSAEETWTINFTQLVIDEPDLCFWMDDMSLLAKNRPVMTKFLQNLGDEIISSRWYPEYPFIKRFPLKQLFDNMEAKLGACNYWFNNTVAYIVAYAIFIREDVTELHLHGVDFLMRGVEKGDNRFGEGSERACVNFWLGVAFGCGIKVHVNPASSLQDNSSRTGLVDEDPQYAEYKFLYGYWPNPTVEEIGERHYDRITRYGGCRNDWVRPPM